ncbi:hypothetical protein BD779DRAFT_1523318, partial [Infundibulicybe gibba]
MFPRAKVDADALIMLARCVLLFLCGVAGAGGHKVPNHWWSGCGDHDAASRPKLLVLCWVAGVITVLVADARRLDGCDGISSRHSTPSAAVAAVVRCNSDFCAMSCRRCIFGLQHLFS